MEDCASRIVGDDRSHHEKGLPPAMSASATNELTMFSTPWCGYCKRLKVQMEREGIAFVEVNIDEDPESAEFVVAVNHGNATVPTVYFEETAPP